MTQRRHTRDGTRRRSYNAGGAFTTGDGLPASPGNVGRLPQHFPRSDDDAATQNAAALGFYTDANNAAANSNTVAWADAVKNAARAAAAARSGANATGDGGDEGEAAEAEAWAVRATRFSLFSCNTAECRTRGGTATLCGFSEFVSPSTPPKKYLTNAINEAFVWCTYGSNVCSGTAARFQLSMNGSAQYTAANCALATINYSTRNDTGVCGTPGGSFTVTQRSRLVYDPAFMVLNTNTATLREVGPRPACYNFSGGSHVTASGSGSETLSNEDTEADAITRLQAASSWSNWTAANTTSCAAWWQERTSGFNIAYQEAEFRSTITIPNNVTGTVKVGVFRSVYGAGSFSLYSTSVFSVTGNGSNEDNISMNVPNERGYETYVTCLPAGT